MKQYTVKNYMIELYPDNTVIIYNDTNCIEITAKDLYKINALIQQSLEQGKL